MGDWAHRFGASPLMRMTASWSWSAWPDRIQVRGAMLRARGRAPLRSLWLTPPGAPCRGPQTEPDEDKTSEEKRLTEKAPYKFADRVQIKAASSRYGVAHWFSRPRLSTVAPYPSSDLPPLDSLAAVPTPTPPQPELDKPHPWPAVPRRSGPSCWPAPPAPAGAACGRACAPATSQPERPCARPSGPPRWRR